MRCKIVGVEEVACARASGYPVVCDDCLAVCECEQEFARLFDFALSNAAEI